jgi:hypothetical protein
MGSLPSGLKAEIEFVAGTWTDVTADVDAMHTVSIQYGRSSAFTAPSVGTCNFQLFNQLGTYTPFSQVLTDGVTANPYWPNIIPRKRVRFSMLVASVRTYLFTGYIKSWQPAVIGGTLPVMMVTATDRFDQLSRVNNLQPAYVQTMLADGPFALWPNNDPAGSWSSNDIVGGAKLRPTQGVISPNASWTWGGSALPVSAAASEQPGVTLGASSALQGAVAYTGTGVPQYNWSIEAWGGLPVAGTAGGANVMVFDRNGPNKISFYDAKDGGASSGTLQYQDSVNAVSVPVPSTKSDGQQHHYVITGHDAILVGGGLTVIYYIDGVQVATFTGTGGGGGLRFPSGQPCIVSVNSQAVGTVLTSYGPVALYPVTLGSGRVQMHYNIGAAVNQTTGARVFEYLYWAGLQYADVSYDNGKSNVAVHPALGKDVLSMCQEMAATEGGCAVLYVNGAGVVVFWDRTRLDVNFRSVTVTLDAVNDLANDVFQPSLDDLTLVNNSTVTMASTSTAYTFSDTASVAKYGGVGDTGVTTYTSSAQDAQALAQSRVRTQCTPKFRLPQIAFDALTSETNLFAVMLAYLNIGFRISVTGLTKGMAPRTREDGIIEGITYTIGQDTFRVLIDAASADNPAPFQWDGGDYGRWQPALGAMTLNSSITSSATTVLIASSGPPITTSAVTGTYPMLVKIDEEIMQFNSAPSGSTSPQTFTGVTRGMYGSTAVAHSAGAAFSLWPASTWTL